MIRFIRCDVDNNSLERYDRNVKNGLQRAEIAIPVVGRSLLRSLALDCDPSL